MPGRTGWSAYELVCVNGTFEKGRSVQTSDSGRDKRYSPSEYRTEIINSLRSDGYSSSEAEAIYQAAVSTGESLVYQAGSKRDVSSTGERKWHPCRAEERGGYYNNLDFDLTLTITIVEDGGPVISPPGGGGEPTCEELGNCPPPPPPPPITVPGNNAWPSCSFNIIYQGSGGSIRDGVNSPRPSGEINSNNGQFNVTQGIPTSELLKTNARSEEYIYGLNFENNTGIVAYQITATKTFNLNWFVGDQEYLSTTTESETVTVTRDWAYWEVITYWLSQLDSATMKNYALPNGEVNMPANLNVSATASTDKFQNNHVFPAPCPTVVLPSESINGSSAPSFYGEAKAAAESATGLTQVRNDLATFKGSTIMSNSLATTSGPRPSTIPAPRMVELKRENLLIDSNKTNYFEAPSTGTMHYRSVVNINGQNPVNFPFNVNHVTVHTPVVIYAKATDDKEHDQRTNPPTRSNPVNNDTEIAAFVLDRPFTISMPTKGQHRNIPGYGNRDYAKWTREKLVRFPFDVYSETKQRFYPANTWINIPVDIIDVKFFLPVWVPEGRYTVDFKTIAENAPAANGGEEHEANVTIPNGVVAGHQSAAHTATDNIKIDVVGRLYDFNVTDITDYNWQDVFRTSDGFTLNNTRYFVGSNGIDGDSRNLDSQFVLPVNHSSHPNGYTNVAIKKGYTFRFDLKTKGNMQADNDAIRIKPTFYFVNKDGSNRREVDLYYHEVTNNFVKVGSEQDKTYRQVVLNDAQRNITETELMANADYYYRHADIYDGMEELTKDYYATSFARKYLRSFSKEEQTTGPYGWQILNWKLRTFIGPEENEVPANTMVPPSDAVASQQAWYGEYSIPSNVYAVEKGKSLSATGQSSEGLSGNNAVFLNDGYIIVNFDIESLDSGDLDNPRLQYINAPLVNQWYTMEGFKRSFVAAFGNTFTSKDGDVAYYHGDQSSQNDFNSSVTH
ncbi:DUF5704 domain-containing protein [Solibacillus sp. NPDC093137]|uniref:DUF5704 domain-containing protein n=1 Tax=Solibacillus sp. NPDC093137 TaxID=3390678 RepID=UPI003D058A68